MLAIIREITITCFFTSYTVVLVLELLRLLGRIPGISNFSEVTSYPFISQEDVGQKTLEIWRDGLENKSFRVRVKRLGDHDFSSTDLERFVGGELNQAVASARVQLKNPDITLSVAQFPHRRSVP